MMNSIPVLEFPVDRGIRRLYFVEESFTHPAKLHLGLLQWLIDRYTVPGDTLLDPMAGTGSLMIAATQQRNVILRDVEPSYVALMQKSVPIVHRRAGLFGGLIDIDQADARTLVCPPFTHSIFSPPYGFETTTGVSAERHRAMLEGKFGTRWKKQADGSVLASWCIGFRYKGEQNNTGNKSGRNYWREMHAIYANLTSMMPSGGKLILVLKNHYRRGKLIDVVARTIGEIEGFGVCLVARHARLVHPLSIWQRRRKEQGLPICEIEDVLVFEKDR